MSIWGPAILFHWRQLSRTLGLMDATNSTRQCRWFRFGVRGILLLTVLASLPLAWKVNRVQVQRRAVEIIRERGRGHVEYDWETIPDSDLDYYTRPSTRASQCPNWLRLLLGKDFFSEVSAVHVGDELEVLAVLADLRDLQLVHSSGLDGIDDQGVALVAKATSATVVSIGRGTFSDTGLKQLARMPRLKYLTVRSEFITDEGIAQLQRDLPACSIQWLSFKHDGWRTFPARMHQVQPFSAQGRGAN